MNEKSQTKADVIPLKSVTGQCPLCGRPTAVDFRPFCSKRCAERDLGRWLNESYRIETDDAPNPDDSTEDDT